MKKITIHDIAQELNITFSTVARALNDNPAISRATKKAVKETAERLGYRQNKLASSLRLGKSHIIGVIVPSLHVSFFSSVVAGIEQIMNDNGYSILLYQSNESLIQEKKGIETFTQLRVDGIISSITTETHEHEHYLDIKKRNIPLVLFDRIISGLNAPSVTVNDYQGGFLATEHLIRQNYKNILHITADHDLSIYKERLRGYRDALTFNNIPVQEELIVKGKSSKEFGRSVVADLLDRNVTFDAVFALDFTAIGVIQELKSRNISIPDEVGVIGFANESFGELITPSLSTVDQQTVRMGEEAAKLFLKISETDRSVCLNENVILEPLLIVRESSRRVRKC